jgi:hypothetical protein
MADPLTVDRARQLYDSGRPEDARSLLLAAGFEDGLDPVAQAEYERLFPIPPVIAGRLAEYARALTGSDVEQQIATVKSLAREAAGEVTIARQAWLGQPATTELLTGSLARSGPTEREKILFALGRIFGWYFRDLRALPTLLPHLREGSADVRWRACGAVGALGEPALVHLFAALHDKADKVRREALAQIGLTLHRRLSAQGRGLIRTNLLHELDHPDPVIRVGVAEVLGCVGEGETIATLTAWLKREPDAKVKSAVREAIAQLKVANQ